MALADCLVRDDTKDPNWECTRKPTTPLEGVRRGTTTSTSTRVGTNSSVSALKGSSVTIGIDAAVVANRHVVVRHPQAGRKGEVVDEFADAPSLAGMDALTKQWA